LVLLADFIVLEEFGDVVAEGGTWLVISSIAGYMFPPLDRRAEVALAQTPADDLLRLPFLSPEAVPDSVAAYWIAKGANRVTGQGAAVTRGERAAR